MKSKWLLSTLCLFLFMVVLWYKQTSDFVHLQPLYNRFLSINSNMYSPNSIEAHVLFFTYPFLMFVKKAPSHAAATVRYVMRGAKYRKDVLHAFYAVLIFVTIHLFILSGYNFFYLGSVFFNDVSFVQILLCEFLGLVFYYFSLALLYIAIKTILNSDILSYSFVFFIVTLTFFFNKLVNQELYTPIRDLANIVLLVVASGDMNSIVTIYLRQITIVVVLLVFGWNMFQRKDYLKNDSL
ncbi:WxPxxD family membrane protein [Peribacillus sp. SI8-4]|uniref:WxPxxD family membrane protein n=1 Tax=Peribacillus sp. SI8-4 TaxID=3048009 RepID=UPI002554F239|nr:WxPxxD family membrane protein [Peribacillus sp. SI8-4]